MSHAWVNNSTTGTWHWQPIRQCPAFCGFKPAPGSHRRRSRPPGMSERICLRCVQRSTRGETSSGAPVSVGLTQAQVRAAMTAIMHALVCDVPADILGGPQRVLAAQRALASLRRSIGLAPEE